MLYNIIAVFICCLISYLVVKNIEKDGFNIKNKFILAEILLFLLGFIVRTVGIQYFPIGLNTDEASSGYEAYSILNYGIDRNGNFLPIFLVAWGSGQNALYTYLMIPFVKLFGLNIITTRLTMAIIGCISLIIWFLLLKMIKNKKFAIVGLAFLCICPWHIMKSRWGLESNIFPDLILWAIYFLISYLKTKKKFELYISCLLMGISSYAYGTAYFFLPIFCLILFAYLLYKKEVDIKDVLICFGIIFIIALPIILCVIINTFELSQINLPFMTIPRMQINRYEEQTSLFSDNFISNCFENIKNSVLLLFLQDDKLPWNSIKCIGMYYIISIPLIIIGVIISFKDSKLKNDNDNIINIWFISAFLLLFVFKQANINRINILIFPLVYYIVNGLFIITQLNSQKIKVVIFIVYFINFILFLSYYLNISETEYSNFANNISDVINYVDSIEDVEKIYFQYAFKEPYIYVLYYTKCNPHEYIDTLKCFPNSGEFEKVESFGKYNFYLPDNFDEKNCVYVITKDNDLQLDYGDFEIKEFEKYLVLKR